MKTVRNKKKKEFFSMPSKKSVLNDIKTFENDIKFMMYEIYTFTNFKNNIPLSVIVIKKMSLIPTATVPQGSSISKECLFDVCR